MPEREVVDPSAAEQGCSWLAMSKALQITYSMLGNPEYNMRCEQLCHASPGCRKSYISISISP